MYIAIEGIDTAGKSTQIEALRKYFQDAIITKEPGGTELGAKMREILLSGKLSHKAEFLLFLADRAEHIEKVVKPNLSKLIISDRSAVSGVAYAMTQGAMNSYELKALNDFATSSIYPDIVFLLQLSQVELEYRLSQKSLDGIEKRGSKYLLTIQENIPKAAKLLGIKLITIDASMEIEKITDAIIQHISL